MQERQRWDKVSTALENTLQAQKIFLVFTSKPMILLFSNDTLFSPHSSQTPGSNVCFMYVVIHSGQGNWSQKLSKGG